MSNEVTPASGAEAVSADQETAPTEQQNTRELSAREIRANARAAASMFCGIAIEIPAIPTMVTGIVVDQEKILIPGISGAVMGLGLCAVGVRGWVRDKRRQS